MVTSAMLLEKLNRYCIMSVSAGTIPKDTIVTFAGASYLCLSKFWDCTTSCEGNIFQKMGQENKIVVAYKGSVEFKDWFRDFWWWKKNWPYAKTSLDMEGIKIHTGFQNQYSSVRMKVMREISDIICDKEKKGILPQITFCGHSLGAALSTISILDAHELFKNRAVFSSYVYGSPRVFNDKGACVFSGIVAYAYRTTLSRDLIPQLPFARMGFCHIGKPVHILSSLKIVCKEEPQSIFTCTYKDHIVGNYVNAFGTLVNIPGADEPLKIYENTPA